MSAGTAGGTVGERAGQVDRSARAVLLGVVVLLGVDLVGGVLAIAADVNTVGEAWSSQALLAAPWPMMLVQLGLMLGQLRWRDWKGTTAAVLLAIACLVSAVSGFFDGGLGNDELSTGLTVYQVFLLLVTATVGLLAVRRALVRDESLP